MKVTWIVNPGYSLNRRRLYSVRRSGACRQSQLTSGHQIKRRNVGFTHERDITRWARLILHQCTTGRLCHCTSKSPQRGQRLRKTPSEGAAGLLGRLDAGRPQRARIRWMAYRQWSSRQTIRPDRRELLRNAHHSEGCGNPIFRHKLRRGPLHPLIGRHMVFSGYMGG
jgi:hypothetical protein